MIRALLLKNRMLLIAFGCLIIFSVYDNGSLHENAASLLSSNSSLSNRFFKVISLTSIAIITYYSVVCCLIARSYILRIVGTLLFCAGVVNALSSQVSGSFPDAMLMGVAIQNRHFAGAFISNNWKLVLYVLAYSSAILALVIWVRAKLSLACSNKVAASLLLLAIIGNYTISSSTGGRRPAFYGYNVTMASAKAIFTQVVPYTKRAKVVATECTQCPDLVFYVIDESVTYEALSAVNSIVLQASAISERLGVPAFTYKAYSAGNHSAVSNYVLRLGVGKSSYPDSNHATLALPSIFSYANASGYKTVLYDAQSENGRLQNDLSPFDLADIDHFITSAASSKFYDRDLIALRKLRKFIDEANPTNRVAITLVKWGAHYPYLNSIPPQLIEELQPECRSTDMSFSSQKLYCTKAQYEAALRFSVDQFMEQVFSILDGKNFALVYTSDHGQNISSKNQLPHGSPENASECEISVPILIAGKTFIHVKPSSTRKSHFQIPATLLNIFGFASKVKAGEGPIWSEWHGGSDFLRNPFEPAGQWHKAMGSCAY